MDELELLKKDWSNKDYEYPNLSYKDIYKMIHTKSSSIVKWIFIISLLEFGFWFIVAIVAKSVGFENNFELLDSNTTFIVISSVGYLIFLYFFYKFYMNYKGISATDNAKKLMQNILKTRNTVKLYVLANLVYLVIGTLYGIIYFTNTSEQGRHLIENATSNGELFKFYASLTLITLLFLVIVIAFLLLFYWLIYGILLKRLNRNYNELKKLEV